MRAVEISNVSLRIVDDGHDRLVAWASCTIDGCLRLNNVAIRRSNRSGLMLTYPAKQTGGGRTVTYFHPITTEASKAIEDAILAKLQVFTARGGHA